MDRVIAAARKSAQDWTDAVELLASAWRSLDSAATEMRVAGMPEGPLAPQLLYPRAMYELASALSEAKCPWPTMLHHNPDARPLIDHLADAEQYYVSPPRRGRPAGSKNKAPESVQSV